MTFWSAVVIIVMIWGIVQIYTRHGDREVGLARDEDGNPLLPQRDDAGVRRELEELRERIKVLERIATETNTLDAREARRISSEIEALREKQSD